MTTKTTKTTKVDLEKELSAAIRAGTVTPYTTSYYRGYVSRKGNGVVDRYSGKYGNGYTHRFNDGTSTYYSRVTYYIFKTPTA